MLALASRALIHSRDGETLSFLYSFMYHLFEDDVVEVKLLNNLNMLMAFSANILM